MVITRGNVALITGGVSGIGLGVAKAFAAAGMNLALTYRRETTLRAAMSCFEDLRDIHVHPIKLDVTDRDSVARAAEETQRVFGKVHVLCNSAGVSLMGAMDTATYEDWDWILGVNLGGVINTLISFLPLMKAHGEGGHIVNVASMSSFITGPGAGVYATSKFALRGLTEGLRYNLAPYRIGVSLACPGLTRTEIYRAPLNRPERLARTGAAPDEDLMQRLQRVHAVGMDPDEVGRKISNGVVRGDFYIFPHSEFRDEVRDLCDEIVASMSTAEAPDPKRADFEHMRRRAKAEATQAIDRLRESARSREAVPGRQESAAELERTRNICREVDRQMACGEQRYHELHHVAQAARIELAAEQWGRPGEREARAKVQARLVSAELEQQAILRELALIETETSAWVPPRGSHV